MPEVNKNLERINTLLHCCCTKAFILGIAFQTAFFIIVIIASELHSNYQSAGQCMLSYRTSVKLRLQFLTSTDPLFHLHFDA